MVKKNLAAKLETITSPASSFVCHTKLEKFHEFLSEYTYIFTENVCSTKDYANKNLKNLIEYKDLVVILSDKGSCVIIFKRSDCDKKYDRRRNF